MPLELSETVRDRFLSALKRAEDRGREPSLEELGLRTASDALDVLAVLARTYRFHYQQLGFFDASRPEYFANSCRQGLLNPLVERWERESGSSLAARILEGYALAAPERRRIVADNIFRSSYVFNLKAIPADSTDLRALRADEHERGVFYERLREENDGRGASAKKVRDGLDRFEAAVRASSTAPSAHEFLGKRLTRYQEGKLVEFLQAAPPEVCAAFVQGLAGTQRAYWKGFLQRNAAIVEPRKEADGYARRTSSQIGARGQRA